MAVATYRWTKYERCKLRKRRSTCQKETTESGYWLCRIWLQSLCEHCPTRRPGRPFSQSNGSRSLRLGVDRSTHPHHVMYSAAVTAGIRLPCASGNRNRIREHEKVI